MHARLILLVVIAAFLVIDVSTARAISMPPGCPSGFHVAGSTCESDATHPAPSSPQIQLPNRVILHQDARAALRWGLGTGGLALGTGMVALALATRAGHSRRRPAQRAA